MDEAPRATSESETGEASLYDLFLANGRRDIDRWHHYFTVYERYFAPFRGRAPRVLEIGVRAGGGLRLWRRYFGPEAEITGIDIDPDCARHGEAGIAVLIGDQADEAFLLAAEAARGPFDIVIDDGGHTARQQINALQTLAPRLADGGVYVVEDVHTSLWPEYLDHPLGVSFLDVATRMAEKLTWWHRDRESFARYSTPPFRRQGGTLAPAIARMFSSIAFYDSLVVFEKAAVAEPWREIR